MNYTEQAIKKAISGGYDEKAFSRGHINLRVANTDIGSIDMPLDCIFLDSLFWETLGKGLGNKEVMRCDSKKCDNPQCPYAGYKDPHMMFTSFTEWIWTGATPEEFFKDLLKQ